ncbi:CLUMA_CG006344, isoform A [Clunio marinus]|uniref:m7GpppX diphosphatase n=1 Tax=Clunio marinus TaxID=568069 RepID=A0A1J1HX96_9DIPT|nr:CLUMA_CG006344, isoform A [Clunio marinus]
MISTQTLLAQQIQDSVVTLKISRIYPATEKHIIKYTEQMLFLIEETPVDYITITLPYLKYEQFTLDWVYNIIEHKQETERILYEDLDPKNGFILLPDYKWNGQIETLYLLAIVMRKDIKSIRDLDSNHLPLLENIRSKSLEIIEKKYDINSNQIRAYFHYQPSFYHLHVHFTILKYKAPGINCEKSHLLNNVIDNIKMIPDYYQRAILTFSVREMDKLRHAFKASRKAANKTETPSTAIDDVKEVKIEDENDIKPEDKKL